MVLELNCLEQMTEDIIETANLVNAPYNLEKIRGVFNVFGREFRTSPVEFRITNKLSEQFQVSYRYVDLQFGNNPFELAVKTGLLHHREQPIYHIIPEIQQSFSISGYGVDAGANSGLEKIWIFLAKLYSLEEALKVHSLPSSIQANLDFFKKYQLNYFDIVGCDFLHETINVYFPVVNPIFYTKERIQQMIKDLGFVAPTQEEMDYTKDIVFANITFSWHSPKIERLCFYIPAPIPDLVPKDRHPLIERFVNQTPILSEERGFVVGYTFTQKGEYIKIESDYTGNVLGILQACLSVGIE